MFAVLAEPVVVVSLITVVLGPLVALLITWVKKRLRLSESTRDAVAGVTEGDRPDTTDAAIGLLARKLDTVIADNNELKAYIPTLGAWGERGWSRWPSHEREPKPPMPRR